MYPSESRDLAVSVVIYLIAIAFGLALFVVPIYLLSRPTVLENAGAPAVQSVDRGLAARSGRDRFPVAHLKAETIVDPDTVAELNAKTKDGDDYRARFGRRNYARPQRSRSNTDVSPARIRPVYPSFSTLR
jgi:hypothetical protein